MLFDLLIMGQKNNNNRAPNITHKTKRQMILNSEHTHSNWASYYENNHTERRKSHPFSDETTMKRHEHFRTQFCNSNMGRPTHSRTQNEMSAHQHNKQTSKRKHRFPKTKKATDN